MSLSNNFIVTQTNSNLGFDALLLKEGLRLSEEHLEAYEKKQFRVKRAYWGFDKFVNDGVQAVNHFGYLRKRINKHIEEQSKVAEEYMEKDDYDYADYEYGSPSKLVASQDGYGHKKKKKKKRKKVVEICSNSNSGIFSFFTLGTLMINATLNFMFDLMVDIQIVITTLVAKTME